MTYDLRLGDCAVILTGLPDDSVDLTVTSPPYDNLRKYNGYSFNFEMISKELYRVTKQGGVVVWVVGDSTVNGSESLTSFKQAIYFREQCGFNLHDTMIWCKGSTSFPCKKRYDSAMEYMFVFCKGNIKTFNPIMDKPNKTAGSTVHGTDRNPDGTTVHKSAIRLNNGRLVRDYGFRLNYWNIHSEKNSKEHGHPAPFPEQLANDHILSWSNEGDTVLDPFLGSGTTGKMAVLNNRNFIGIEISQEYLGIAEARIKKSYERPQQIGLLSL